MNVVLALLRACQYLAQMGVFGACGLILACAPPGLRPALQRVMTTPVLLAASVNLLACLAYLPAQAVYITGATASAWQPATLWLILSQTSTGGVWLGQTLIAVLWVVGCRFGRDAGDHARPTSLWIALTATALLLASQAKVGHAVMHEGALGLAHQITHVLHLWSTGAWVGALALLPACLRLLSETATRQDAGRMLKRFSGLWQGVVAVALASGVLDAYLVVGGWPGDLEQPYQVLLWLKVAAVLGMTALALVNRYHWVPRLRAQGEQAVASIRRNAAVALALGLLAIALVSYFGLLSPTPGQ